MIIILVLKAAGKGEFEAATDHILSFVGAANTVRLDRKYSL